MNQSITVFRHHSNWAFLYFGDGNWG